MTGAGQSLRLAPTSVPWPQVEKVLGRTGSRGGVIQAWLESESKGRERPECRLVG